MADKLDPKEIVSFKELLMANSGELENNDSTPATMLLVGSGLFGLARFRRKVKK